MTTFLPSLTADPRRIRRGQTIVVALLVLLLLGLVGAVFVTIVARNLINARHANRVVTADYYARAGVTFADAQLTYSPDGADWRPPLQFTVANPPTEAREAARYNAAVTANNLTAAGANDPDKTYLDAGFARYDTGGGRFLLRVTYDPVNLNGAGVAPGRYLKVESIGREGVVDPTDPTTYANNRSTDRTQAVLVAYKPIGITDYARFETNPDKRSDIANLGVVSQLYLPETGSPYVATPGVYDFLTDNSGNVTLDNNGAPILPLQPIVTTYGAPDAYLQPIGGGPVAVNPTAGTGQTVPSGFKFQPGGGSMRANMAARYYGENIAYLYDAGADAPTYQDTIEIAGDLLLDGYLPTKKLDNSDVLRTDNPLVGQQSALIVNPPTGSAAPLVDYAAPSNDTGSVNNGGFYSFNGLVRDGSTQDDNVGQPRGIARLEPPQMDGVDPASSLPRYKALAMMSPPRLDPASVATPQASYPAGSSQYGYGKFIYVDNTEDVQPESTSIGGGTNLTDEWLHQASPSGGDASKGNWNGHFYDPPGVSITLGQVLPSGTYGIRLTRGAGAKHWVAPDGVTDAGTVLDVPYSDLDNDRTAASPGATADNDEIIYAEGNVRLRGTLSPEETLSGASQPVAIPRHITIVTNGTAYIEGNLLKGNPDSSITVLAHDYVCVNTTQFLAGAMGLNPSPPTVGNAFELQEGLPLIQEFSFGLPSGVNTGTTIAGGGYGGNSALYVSVSSDGAALADYSITNISGPAVNFTVTEAVTGLTPTHATLPLNGVPTTLDQTAAEKLTVERDPGAEGSTNTSNVLLERVAVLPMDIRIEAVLFAQTRSFFVIPGDWFNTSPSDTLDTFANTVTAANPSGDVRPFGGDTAGNNTSRFPFYGQPIDLKITIDGAVSEARPANVATQTAWMLKWGWIPQYHGNLIGLNNTTSELAGHPNRVGLQIIYNPQAGYPYDPGSASASPAVPPSYLRSDQYGRPLPFAPKLPVSTGLLYAGQSGDVPILQ